MAGDHTVVAIVDMGSPRCLNDESAPIGTTAPATCRCHVRHTAIGVLGIAPGVQPVIERAGSVLKGLQGHGRGVAVATVSHSLKVRAINHVTAEGEAANGTLDHVVNGVQIAVGAYE